MMEEPTSKITIPELARELLHLPFDHVVPSQTNPRLNLDREPFEELKKSIFANGLLQPVVVRPKGDVYEIIGGHRRFAALKELGNEHPSDRRFTRIAVVVVAATDAMVPVLQLAENLNRSDLTPVEVADGMARAVECGVDAQQLADSLGWSRRTLNRCLQLAEAPAWLREYAREVRVQRKRLDTAGKVVVDPKTNKAVVDTERYPGFPATYLNELLMLYHVLKDADVIALEDIGGDGFRAHAERTTRRLAQACASGGWTLTRLRAEVKRAKDPAPRKGGAPRALSAPVTVTNERCVVDLRRAQELSAQERAELAARLTEALARCRFKSVLITP
ncbi:MAG: ParB/RepB/Spo0J family partition protein [Deltaproteobacteria bacterium]|nr:ParB/RepB/Spo0J family partition protein [Deltaproteobacteria bacterium]